MVKRNSTADILDALTEGDKIAAERKAEALRSIPAPEWVEGIDRKSVRWDREFNSRHGETYSKADNADLYESLRVNGLEHRGDSMVFHRDPADGSLSGLVGHLRSGMMDILDTEYHASQGKEGRAFPTVFGLVYTGLTLGQRHAIMADHIGRKELTESQRCKEVAEFQYQNGLTDDATSKHFGIDVNKVARYRMRWAMPTVYGEYVKETLPKSDRVPFVRVKQKQLTRLYSAYMIDFKATNRHRVEGPAFREIWTQIQNDPTAFVKPTDGPATSGPTVQARADIINQADGCKTGFGDGPEIVAIASALRWAAGDKTIDLHAVRQTVRDYADGLRSDVERLTLDVATARDAERIANERAESLRSDVDGLTSEVNDLRSKVAAKVAAKK